MKALHWLVVMNMKDPTNKTVIGFLFPSLKSLAAAGTVHGIMFVSFRTNLMLLAWTPTALVLVFFLCLTWMQNAGGAQKDFAKCPPCGGRLGVGGGGSDDGTGDIIAKNHWIRMMLFLLVVILISCCTVIMLVSGFVRRN